jgi:lambda repressor-like predicted transcriptional regulator
MGKVVKKPKRLVVLDLDRIRFPGLQVRGAVLCQGREEIARRMRRASPRTFWISTKQQATDDLLRSAPQCRYRRGPISGLVTLEPPRPNSIPGLNSCFRHLAGAAPDSKLLPLEELLDVLSAPQGEAAGLFIAAVADPQSQTLALTRGNFKTVTVPFSMFPPSGTGIQPDFGRLSLTDYGQTVRLGDYEAAADAILYEADPEYRRKTRKKLRAEEKTFGASLRRLRIQKGLSRSDFATLSSKTIARIERNEVEKPHGETLRTIADRLGVEPDEIESY